MIAVEGSSTKIDQLDGRVGRTLHAGGMRAAGTRERRRVGFVRDEEQIFWLEVRVRKTDIMKENQCRHQLTSDNLFQHNRHQTFFSFQHLKKPDKEILHR